MVGRAPNIQHSAEVKNAAVLELCTRTTDALTIADSVGVCRPTLYSWKNQLLGREVSASMMRRQAPQTVPQTKQVTELEQQVSQLERAVRRLQLEHDILNKANDLLKKGQGVAPQLLSNREKTLLVDALKATYTAAELLIELDLARSSYFYHCARLKSADKYAEARIAITDASPVAVRIAAIAVLDLRQVKYRGGPSAVTCEWPVTGSQNWCRSPARIMRSNLRLL